MPLPPTQCWKAVCGRLRWRTFAALRRRCGGDCRSGGAGKQLRHGVGVQRRVSSVTNDPALVAAIEAQLGRMPPALEGLALTTEDFAWYQQELPGVFFFLGVGDTEELHSARFTFDERVLERGPGLLRKTAGSEREWEQEGRMKAFFLPVCWLVVLAMNAATNMEILGGFHWNPCSDFCDHKAGIYLLHLPQRAGLRSGAAGKEERQFPKSQG